MLPKRIAGPAGTLQVDDGGIGGIPVVFVHSFAGSSAHWKKQLEHVRRTRRALAIDLRGHGHSAAPASGDYGIASLAADIGAVVKGLGLTQVILVGHSLGGAAAIAYAASHPQRVSGLMLVGAPGRIPTEQGQQIVRSLEADYDKVMGDYWTKLLADATPEVRRQIMGEMHRLPRADSISIIKATMEYDPVTALRSYKGPVMIVSTPQGDTPNDLQRLLPNLPHEPMRGTSHWLQLDKPKEFQQILDAFLLQVARGAARVY